MSDETKTPAQDTTEVGSGASGNEAQADAKAPAEATKPEASAQEAKPESKAPEAEKPVVPEKYDLKLPDGSQLDAKAIEKVASYAKEKGLTNEQAQALLERENTAVAEFAERQKQEVKAKLESWVNDVKADKEIGGDAFNANAELAKRVIERYATPEFKATLDETGLGNHPELVRVFVRIGRAMAEDQLVLPGKDAAGMKRDPAEILYGSKN